MFVIPAKAGIQRGSEFVEKLGPRSHEDDDCYKKCREKEKQNE
jgi:hypothetical protein